MRNLLKALRGYEADVEQTPVKEYQDILQEPDSGSAKPMEVLPEDFVLQLPLEEFLTYKVAVLHAMFDEQLQYILSETCKLSITQWRVLNVVGHLTNVSTSRLKLKTKMDSDTVSTVLAELDDMALVSLQNEDDAGTPKTRVSLAAEGRVVFDRMCPVIHARQRLLMSELSAEDRAALYSSLDKLTHAVERMKFT